MYKPLPTYDIIICVGPKDRGIIIHTLRQILKHLVHNSVYIITAPSNFSTFAPFECNVTLIDEESVIEGLSLKKIEAFLGKTIHSTKRAGWYFQQLLKMAMAQRDEISEHYLIWDADTLPLKPLSFFSPEGKVLVKPSNENTQSYFRTINNLLSLDKNQDFSFISEHMMITKQIMLELIHLLDTVADQQWYWNILNAINPEDLEKSGFSEYETYGTYLTHTYPDSFTLRTIRSTRFGTHLSGHNPNKYDLYWLSKQFSIATFEHWDKPPSPRRLVIRKSQHFFSYLLRPRRLSLTLVTAADSSHAQSLFQFLRSIQKFEPSSSVIIYDLGLGESLASLQEEFLFYTFKPFEFSKYPPHFNIKINAGEYAWKPLIIQETLHEVQGAICWMDAGNLLKGPLKEIRKILTKQGIYSPTSSGTIEEWTHPTMLNNFGVPKAIYTNKNRNGACIAINYASPQAMDLVGKWACCALDKECIAPQGSSRVNHRQDQSAFTVLLNLAGRYNDIPEGLYNFKTHQDIEPQTNLQPSEISHEN